MTNKLRLVVAFTLMAIATHLYLSLHYYGLNYGSEVGQSLCNINAAFDCDSVSTSRFASLFGIPMALWGLAANLVFLGLVLTVFFRLTEHPKRLLRYSLWMSGFIAITSLIMGAISLKFLTTYCLFCIATYVFSFLIFGLLLAVDNPSESFAESLKGLWSHSLTVTLSVVISIPAIGFLGHRMLLEQYDTKNMAATISTSVSDWRNSVEQSFSTTPALAKGPERGDAKIIVSEFADFLCIHCKMAAPKLRTFARANPDVRFEFYAFPLDGSCNPVIGRSSGIPCRIAKAVHCAGKADKGWELHDIVFENQSSYVGSVDKTDVWLKNLSEQLQLDWEKLKTCMDQPETQDAISNQAKAGDEAGVKGTPSIYVNGKKIVVGVSLLLLNEIKKEILDQ